MTLWKGAPCRHDKRSGGNLRNTGNTASVVLGMEKGSTSLQHWCHHPTSVPAVPPVLLRDPKTGFGRLVGSSKTRVKADPDVWPMGSAAMQLHINDLAV